MSEYMDLVKQVHQQQDQLKDAAKELEKSIMTQLQMSVDSMRAQGMSKDEVQDTLFSVMGGNEPTASGGHSINNAISQMRHAAAFRVLRDLSFFSWD